MNMSAPPTDGSQELRRTLKQRHLTMIGLGGVIGAGLFVGSGAVINIVGPAAVLTFAIAGAILILVMRMLGEMAVAMPDTGSFSSYSRKAFGGWAGFSVGWLYWYFWVIIVGFEAVAGASLLQRWVDAPLWLMALVLLALMTLTNLISVGAYGEFEYWFASIKVVSVIVFIAATSAFALGLWPGRDLDVSNWTAHGGFAPNGISVILGGVAAVILSMAGAEMVTIAAAEAEEPARGVIRATNSVMFRVLVFFVGSVALIVTVMPWNDSEVGSSPYVTVLDRIGVAGASDIMNAVVLTAVLSCLNSGLYTSSRMLITLARNGEAPRFLTALNRRQVPVRAVLACTLVGYLCVAAAYIWPETIFTFLLNSCGVIGLFVYLMITASQLKLRRQLERSGDPLTLKMWLFPYLSIATALAITAALVSLYLDQSTRSQVILGLASWAVLLTAYGMRHLTLRSCSRRGGEQTLPAETPAEIDTHTAHVHAADSGRPTP